MSDSGRRNWGFLQSLRVERGGSPDRLLGYDTQSSDTDSDTGILDPCGWLWDKGGRGEGSEVTVIRTNVAETLTKLISIQRPQITT